MKRYTQGSESRNLSPSLLMLTNSEMLAEKGQRSLEELVQDITPRGRGAITHPSLFCVSHVHPHVLTPL